MKTVLVTSPHSIMFEAAKANQMFLDGLGYFVVKKPRFSQQTTFQLVAEINPDFHSRIFLSSYYYYAARKKLGGIIINRTMRHNIFFRWFQLPILRMIHPNIKIMTSVRSHRSLNHLPSYIDMVLLNGLFDKQRPEEFSTELDLHILESKLDNTTKEVYAYGGVCNENLDLLKGLKLAGVALQGTIWKSPDPLQCFRDMKQVLDSGALHLHTRTISYAK